MDGLAPGSSAFTVLDSGVDDAPIVPATLNGTERDGDTPDGMVSSRTEASRFPCRVEGCREGGWGSGAVESSTLVGADEFVGVSCVEFAVLVGAIGDELVGSS